MDISIVIYLFTVYTRRSILGFENLNRIRIFGSFNQLSLARCTWINHEIDSSWCAVSIPTVELKIHEEKIPIALVMGTNTGWLVTRFTIGYHTRGKAWYCTTRTSKDEGDETEGPFPFFLLSHFFFFLFFYMPPHL